MSRKRLPCRSIFAAAALLLAALVFAPASPARVANYNRTILRIINATSSQITILAAMVTEGQWIQGQQAVPGTQYPANSTIGPFSTFSPIEGEGNGGSLYLNVGIIGWQMPSIGQPRIEVKLKSAGIQAQVNGPLPDPDGQHVVYNITITKK